MNSNQELSKLRFKKHLIDETLLKQARKEGNIVYGSQAIKRKLGINARPPSGDWDFFAKKPKKSAIKAETNLDVLFKKDIFFTKKGTNPSTYRVKHKGKDLRPKTKDDIEIADFTKTPKPIPKTFKFRKVKYRTLQEELKAKEKLLRNKKFVFRKSKDLEDLKRIKRFGGLK